MLDQRHVCQQSHPASCAVSAPQAAPVRWSNMANQQEHPASGSSLQRFVRCQLMLCCQHAGPMQGASNLLQTASTSTQPSQTVEYCGYVYEYHISMHKRRAACRSMWRNWTLHDGNPGSLPPLTCGHNVPNVHVLRRNELLLNLWASL